MSNDIIILDTDTVVLTHALTGKKLSFFRKDVVYVLSGESGSLLKLVNDHTVWEVDEIVTLADLVADHGVNI